MTTGAEYTERASPPRPRCRRLTGFRVIGTGSYVPDIVVDNTQLHERFGFDSDWIVKRTGILERRHARPHQATSDLSHAPPAPPPPRPHQATSALCHEAALRCLQRADVRHEDIDLLVLATFTPDMS